MSKKRGVLARRIREADPPGPPRDPAPRAVMGPVMPAQPAPAPPPVAPSTPAPAAPSTPAPRSAMERLRAARAAPAAPPVQTPAYQQAKAGLEGIGVGVHDAFAPQHDTVARANTFSAAHEALSHAHTVLPQLGKLAAHHGLQVHFSGTPQSTAAGDLHGLYSHRPGAAPRLDVHNQAQQTLWHEYGHHVDHALNNLQSNGARPVMATEVRSHPLRQLVDDLRQTDAHKTYVNAALGRAVQSGNTDQINNALYLGAPDETFSRFFNAYMNHSYQQKTGRAGSAAAGTAATEHEQYSPQDLEHFGGRLHNILSNHAVRLGGRFERSGPMQIYTPGRETAPVTAGAREAEAPATPEAPRPGVLSRVKTALGGGRSAPTMPVPSTPAPATQPGVPRLPEGAALPPSMRIEGGKLHVTPAYMPEAPAVERRAPSPQPLREVPPEHRPAPIPPHPVAPADRPHTTWLSPAELAAGEGYVRRQHAAREQHEDVARREELARRLGLPLKKETSPDQLVGLRASALNAAGLRDVWGQLKERSAQGEQGLELHAGSPEEYAEGYMDLARRRGMLASDPARWADNPFAGAASHPSTWQAAQFDPESLSRYRLMRGRTVAPPGGDPQEGPVDVPAKQPYEMSPEEFHQAPYVLHRGGSMAAPTGAGEGAMWLTPRRELAQQYAQMRTGSNDPHERAPWDVSTSMPLVTSGVMGTNKYATEHDINKALAQLGYRMEDLEPHMPRTDGGLRAHQALYVPPVLDYLKQQGFGAYEGRGPKSGNFYVKLPWTPFYQHGDLVRQAHAQGLDVGEENRQRYSLGPRRTAAGGQTFWREGPPTVEMPAGPVVPAGHYGVREAARPDGAPFPLPPPDDGRRRAHEAHAHVERARRAYRDAWRPAPQGHSPAQLLAERRLRAAHDPTAPAAADELTAPALAAEADLAQALAGRALARRLLEPAPGPLPWEEDHESAPGEGHRRVGPRPALHAERARRKRAARAQRGDDVHPDVDWLRTKEELRHQRALHEALAARGWAPTPHERRELALAQRAHHEALNRRPMGAAPLVQEKPGREEETPDVRAARLLYRDPEQVPASPAEAQRALAHYHAELERRHGPGAGPQAFAEQLRLALLAGEHAVAHGAVREADPPLGPLARAQPAPSAPDPAVPTPVPTAGPRAAPPAPGRYRSHVSRAREEITRLVGMPYGGPERRGLRFVSVVPQQSGAERRATEQLLGPGQSFEESAPRQAAFNLGAAPGDAPRLASALPQQSGAQRTAQEHLLGPGHSFAESAQRQAAFNVGSPPAPSTPPAGPLGRAPRKEESRATGL